MWLWKSLLQNQKNAGSYSSQGAAGESNRQHKQENVGNDGKWSMKRKNWNQVKIKEANATKAVSLE